jgi:hypothetical protein
MRRRYGFGIAAALFVLIAADALYWRTATERLRDGVQGWIQARRAEGWTVEAGPVTAGGWPRAATVSLAGLSMRHAGPAMPGDVRWAVPEVVLSVQAFRPALLRIAFAGAQAVKVGRAPELTVTGERIGLAVPLGGDAGLVADLAASGIRVGPAAGDWHADIALLDAHADLRPGASPATVSFNARAEAVALPPGVKWPLGPAVRSASVSGTLNGPLPEAANVADWARAWRDGGGSLDLKRVSVEWGPMSIVCSATLALDDQLQPMGSGSAKATGYAETLDKLAAGGVLTKSAATVAKAVLSLMAGTAEGDAPASVEVPLTLQYRTLSMRQVPLARLPEVDWPAR